MPPSGPSSTGQLHRQLATLQRRVSALERALRPRRDSGGPPIADVHVDRRYGEERARHEAMREYWERERRQRFREDPRLLKMAREHERHVNEFLRKRGIRPEKSTLPTAKELAAATRDGPKGAPVRGSQKLRASKRSKAQVLQTREPPSAQKTRKRS